MSKAADEKLLAAIDAYAASAYGASNTSELAESRSLAIERYLGRNINPAPEGRSQLRDRTVFETIEWIKPSLLRIFASSDEIVRFDPVGLEDEALADQESFYVNYVVTKKNSWHQIFHDWASDALLLKNGYVHAYWEEKEITESEPYEKLTDDGLAALLEDPSVEVVSHSEYEDEEAPPEMGPRILHDVVLRYRKKKGQVRLCVLPPERCKVDINTPDPSLDGCNYFEYYERKSIGHLRSLGFKVPDDIADTREDEWEVDERARDLYGEDAAWDDMRGSGDPSLRMVTVRYVWARHDYNGDGLAELQYSVIVGSTILSRTEVSEINVAGLSPIPLPHRHIGMSMSDAVLDIEDTNTAFLRQAVDNLFFANNPRTFVSDRVSVSDMMDSRPGSVVRVDGQPPQEVMTHVVPNTFPQAVQAMTFFDQRKQNRTGVNAYFQGTDANTLNKTASGISQLTQSAAQRVEMIARLFFPGVQRLFRIVHKLTLQYGRQAETVRMRGQWVSVNPQEWRERENLTLVVGLGTGNKDSLLAHLDLLLQRQLSLLPLGVATPQNVYATMRELVKAASLSHPEQYVSEPQPPPPPPPPLELTLKQMDGEIAQLKAKSQESRDAAQLQFDQWKVGQDQKLEMWKTEQDQLLKLKLAEVDDQRTRALEAPRIEMDQLRLQREVSADAADVAEQQTLEAQSVAIQQVEQSLAMLAQQVSQLVRVVAAPRRLLRNPKTGKAEGSVPVLDADNSDNFQKEPQDD